MKDVVEFCSYNKDMLTLLCHSLHCEWAFSQLPIHSRRKGAFHLTYGHMLFKSPISNEHKSLILINPVHARRHVQVHMHTSTHTKKLQHEQKLTNANITVVVVVVYFILSRLLYLAFSANLGLLRMTCIHVHSHA